MGEKFSRSSLESYRKEIDSLYKAKGWNTDWRWLVTGYFAESGELIQSIVKGDSDENVTEEFADVMHYLLQLINMRVGKGDLDAALREKIESNKVNRKKTTDSAGRVIFK